MPLIISSDDIVAIRWRRETHGRFRDLCHRDFSTAIADASPLLNWYETMSRLAGSAGHQPVSMPG